MTGQSEVVALGRQEGRGTRGSHGVPCAEEHAASAGSAFSLSQVLPSGLGSLELQVGRFAPEDQGDPRKEEKQDSRKNFLAEGERPATRGVYVGAG